MPGRSTLSLIALFALGGCTSIAPAEPSGDTCAPAPLSRYNGQPATAALGAAMLAETGKSVLRWVPPGMMVTMDFRADRLTVYLDPANKVTRASCG